MGFLRIGVQCAVFDEQRHVLLSKRDDLDIWNLPGGRAERGELLAKTAAREVLEETGVVAYVQQPVGLYYWADFQRLNVLYIGWQFGGRLLQTTHETKANAFFAEDRLPPMPWAFPVHHAFASERPAPFIIRQPAAEVRLIKNKLRWRWVRNLLSGKPEPRFPRFTVTASGLIWNATRERLLLNAVDGTWALPRVAVVGQAAPWSMLANHLRMPEAALQWVGLWQDVRHNALELVFASVIEHDQQDLASGRWVSAAEALTRLPQHDTQFVVNAAPDDAHSPVWTIAPDP
jgi:ADP-ribose pyrophosphatase YjhB (NUDIX family)